MYCLASRYDVAIVGGGHNGLVAACYLAQTGLSVLVLERNPQLGGATRSAFAFEGFAAKLSVYSYLISLFPQKIIDDLGLHLHLKSRRTASYTPAIHDGQLKELLLRNDDLDGNREAFVSLTGDESDYEGFLELQTMQEQLASVIWPSLTEPLVSNEEIHGRLDDDGKTAWQSFVEQPLGEVIESKVASDLVRGLVFTDAKIGVSTHPHDPSLLQNKCFLYHVIGRGTGEWLVPVGGMGSLVDELERVARATGKVTFATDAKVETINPSLNDASLVFEIDGQDQEIDARFVLCNCSALELGRLTGKYMEVAEVDEGAGFKVNMLLERLPRLHSSNCSPKEAFAGTFHVDEGYEQMQTSYDSSAAGEMPATPPGEIYCHSLTDDSILSPELNARGFHTLTLFGLDMPYRLFEKDNEKVRYMALERYLAGINRYLEEPIEDCLAKDAAGKPCIAAMSAVDLENKIHLPRGNIFHGDLTWPFAETEEEVGQWGVETSCPNIFLCGSSARRGGAVSGIPGHNAARKVMEEIVDRKTKF